MTDYGRSVDPVVVGLVALLLACVVAALSAPATVGVVAVAKATVRVMFVGMCWQVAARPGAATGARRFWSALALSGVFFAAGAVFALATGHPAPADSLAASLLVAPGIPVLGWAMIAYPVQLSGPDLLRLRLDVATVMCAFVMAAWYLLLPRGSPPESNAQLALTTAACLIALVVAYAVVKLLLSGSAPFTPAAGLLLGAGLLTGAWVLFNLLRTQTADTQLLQAGQAVAAFLPTIAARVQYVQMRTRPSGRTERRRPVYSLLPYAAVAAAQVLVVATLWRDGLTLRAWGMVAAAITVTVLVMARQHLAFTDNARLLRRLDASRQRFRSLVQHASDLTMLVDGHGRIVYATPSLRQVLGLPPRRAVGRSLTEVLQSTDAEAVSRLLSQAARGPDGTVSERVEVRDGGRLRWLEVVASDRRADLSVGGVVLNIRDITDAKTFEERLRHEATHDHLTGLANRALLDERASQLLDDPDTQSRPEAVLLMDLDGFKAVNDTMGHHVGDALLVAVADRLRHGVRSSDTVARLGGDEFAVLLPGTDADVAVATARRLQAGLSRPVTVEGHQLLAQASIGVAVGCPTEFDALLRAADLAMYQAKRDGTGVHLHGSGGSPADEGTGRSL